MDFSWAENYPDLHKVCTLFSLVELTNPKRFSYTPFEKFLQDGPQCGLVALAIYQGNPSKQCVQSLLETAKSLNYTNQGEMFSAQNLANLARGRVFSGNLDCIEIQEVLLQGGCVLVPYDSGHDFSPCLRNGTKAHWALLCGAVETRDFYVLARHGKARNVAVWKLKDLAESNAQLNDVGVYPKNTNLKFKLPEGGIRGHLGLKNKSVILDAKS